MKVLMTADAVGGVWTYAMELAKALKPAGVDFTIASMGPLPTPEQQRQAAKLRNIDLLSGDFKLEWMNDPWKDVERSGEWLLKLEQMASPDVIHLNGFMHGCLQWSSPVLMVGHSCVMSWWKAVRGDSPPRDLNRYFDSVKHGLHSADALVAPSRAMARSLEDHYGPLPKIRVIPNGRSSQALFPARKSPFVFMAGRLWDEAKNLSALSQIASDLPWPVFVAGDGSPQDGIRLLGNVPSEKMPLWYSRAALYVLPAKYEPFGLTVLEAALSGCALVLGDIDSLRENWQGAALFVRPDDSDALRKAILHLIRDGEARAHYQRIARARGMEFTAERMAAEYLACYRELKDSNKGNLSAA